MSHGLPDAAVEAIREILSRHTSVRKAVLFGSRALGREHARSDIDLALSGDLDALEVEGIALELEELPVPVPFDIHLDRGIGHAGLRAHIERVGQTLYSRKTT